MLLQLCKQLTKGNYMKVKAELRFKNQSILEIIKSHGMNVKQFSEMCGVNSQTVGNVIKFKHNVRPEVGQRIIDGLLHLDPSANVEEFLPKDYHKFVDAFKTKETTQDITSRMLAEPIRDDMIAIESEVEDIDDREDAKIICEKALLCLTKLQKESVEMYYGLNGKKPLTMDKIADKMNVSRGCISERIVDSIKKIKDRTRISPDGDYTIRDKYNNILIEV